MTTRDLSNAAARLPVYPENSALTLLAYRADARRIMRAMRCEFVPSAGRLAAIVERKRGIRARIEARRT